MVATDGHWQGAVGRLVQAVLLAVCLCALSAAGQTTEAGQYEGKPITSIEFRPAVQPVLESEIKRLLTVKTGAPMKIADVRESIEQLFKSGRYEDIQAEVEPAPAGGVILRFVTTESFFITGVAVKGVPDPPNGGQLVNTTRLQLGTLFSEGQLKQAEENLQELLRSNGFYNATIETGVIRRPESEEIDTTFTIKPGKRAHYQEPVIKGNLGGHSEASIVRATRYQRLFGLLGWRQVTENTTQQGVDRVRQSYQKHDQLLAKANLDGLKYDPGTNRVTPSLTVNAGPKVKVKTTGAKLSKGKLQQLVPIYQEQSVDRDLVVEGKRNLTNYFQAQGYFDADVEFNLDRGPMQDTIQYTLTRGSRSKLVKLLLSGNKYFKEETIRERMNVVPASFLRYRNGRYSEALLRRDLNAISDLYKQNGFRDVTVDYRVDANYQGKPRQLAVYITIAEGPQSFVHQLILDGVGKEHEDQIRSLLVSTEGQPFSDLSVATDQDSVLNYYFNTGYPDATFEANSAKQGEPNQFDLHYTVKEGKRQFVRNILTRGLEKTSPKLVRDRLEFKPGDPLSQSKQIDTQRRLYDLGIFARVDTALQNPEGDELSKFVLYRFEEAKRYSLSFGLGAEIAQIGSGGGTASLDSPGGATGFSPRASFGISLLNFRGIGHTVSLQTRISNIQQRALLTYLAPQFVGHENLDLTISAIYDNSKDVRTFAAKREEASVQVGQKLSKANTIQYRLTYRHVSVSNIKITPTLIPLLSQNVRIALASVTFIQDRRDDPIDSHRGIYNSLDAGVTTKLLGSQPEFLRLLGKNATYYRLTKDLVLARSLSFGVLANYGPSTIDVPLPERFFSGGANSHRGFPDNQAGPRDPITGFPIGGKALLMSQTELRFPLIGDNIGGVLFHDAGNVYTDVSSISFRFHQRDLTDFDYMVQSLGFGIRYRTPVGPVRVDLAYSLNSPRFRGCHGTINDLLFNCGPGSPNIVDQRITPIQFHFSLGQAF